MKRGLIGAAAVAGIAHTLAAHLLASSGLGTVHRGPATRRAVALTFDDGPDPASTPRVLETLDGFGARATFFLIGARAEQHPEIVRAIADAGHEIGSHTYTHRHLWLLPPGRTRDEMNRAAETLAAITGMPVRYFRPPWGKFNLAAYRHAKRLGQRRVLWSLRPEGWRPAPDAQAIVRAVNRRLHPGAIIDLHDAAHAPGRPIHTAQALPAILSMLATRGYRCVTLSELLDASPAAVRTRGLISRAWDLYERAWARAYRLESVGDVGLLAIGPTTHRGPTVRLGDGTLIASGDAVCELHFDRHHVMRLHAELPPRRVIFALRRDVERSLRQLAALVARDPRYVSTKAFRGTTLFWEGTPYLGCEVRPLAGRWGPRFFTWYLRMLMARDHPLGWNRLQGRNLEPRVVWLSRQELLRRYGPGA